MFTLATDLKNDLLLDSAGNIAVSSDQSAVELVLRQSLSALTDEYTFNKSGGVDYRSTAFAKTTGWQAVLSIRLREVATTVPEVRSVISVLVWESEGVANFAISVATDFGVISLATGV